ncbi:efflux RND transporter permease subunit [Rhizobium sp. G21]|uniref:efflux RND transporter permease subunit n=1 Tax=Rhizobium sp. G21 TaxID=2758439 RepID=UPI0015FFA089|nr:efflux RND transporter permease subunit [Rhizobium sp. G21]MBB1251294.1 efflux RND transporter permease subunit [Rhizobium sp. G21]
MTQKFNLSEWALAHKSLVWYFMILAAVAGVLSYINLGREEDPDFSIKTMLIQASWPGASIEEMTSQVTDRIEKKLQELDNLDYTKSVNAPGQATIYVNLLDTTKASDVKPTWVKVRNMIADIAPQLPSGVQGPTFVDSFGDVFGNIYAFTSDGLTQRQLRDYLEAARTEILSVPNVGKVELIGAQDEVVYLEFSTRQMAALGVTQEQILTTLQNQNAVVATGTLRTTTEQINLRVSGGFASEDSLRNINLRVNDRFFRLSDVATITRGYSDPQDPLFRVNGQPAIGLAIGMKAGANLLEFGEALNKTMERVIADLPVGVGVHHVAAQAEVVEEAVGGFTKALFEAIAIVLIVSFLSLGMRAGLVVAVSIPLVLAITFVFMEYAGISLQRISLGALIIALGLLVDDAMIAIEMMVSKLEEGESLQKAATAVYTSTAFPMLTGTLVTVASFIPVGLNNSAAGEFTFTLFVVIAVSLIVSWVVAVLFTPLLGVVMLPKTMKKHHEEKGRVARSFSSLLNVCVSWPKITIALTLIAFGVSIYGMGFVQQQFFPSSDRPELVVDWTARQNYTLAQTKAEMDSFEQEHLAGNPDIDHWTSYVGQGAKRFILSFDVQPNTPNFGEMIIVAKDIEARDRLRAQLSAAAEKEFPGSDVFVKLLDLGPPVGRPIQYRVSGPDPEKVRIYARDIGSVLGADPRLGRVVYDWMEPARTVKVEILQDKARQLGVTSSDIATALNNMTGGSTITQIRDSIYLIDVVGRAVKDERQSVEMLRNLQLSGGNGQSVPLASIANFRYKMEQPIIWRRDRMPTITVKVAIKDSTQPATIDQKLEPQIRAYAGKLPVGYKVEVGGSVESSAKSQAPIAAVVPMMLLAMATILMFQLQSFQRLFLVVIVAPLGLIGVVAALLPSGAPLGFVAILGVLALIGILIRNSVILVVQIETLIHEGLAPWNAVIEATEHRMRPIMLTAAAASLALIPISREIFWGPMAYAMMGGIIVGTVLTLLFLPALYVVWFRIKRPDATDVAQKEQEDHAQPSEPHPA